LRLEAGSPRLRRVLDAAGPFRYGVASGDPLPDRVVIWTRVEPGGPEPITVQWFIASFGGDLVVSGETVTGPDRDWAVSIDVTGLAPATRYQYWFEAAGRRSPVGSTRTLPAGDCSHLRFAQVSCAKYNAGYFNAYARIAERDDIDFVLHLGDYIYEASQTPPASQTASADIGRPFDPLHECKTLDDYRRRYAQYRSDPDVQAMHAAHPLIATVDDHEFADGAWRGGATEHREDRDGPWCERLAAAFRAREEWLPVRRPDPSDPTSVFRSVSVGSLAELFVLDTRTRRDEPVAPPASLAPGRSALGREQRDWLFAGLAGSTARWRLIGNPSVLSHTWNDALPERVRAALVKVKLIELDGKGPDWDQWDGYPEERAAVLRHIRETGDSNVVILSGDVHVGLAIEVTDGVGGEPVCVEFVNTSLTSQNLDDKMGWAPLTESLPLAEEFAAGMPHVQWVDFDSHGYCVVDVAPDRVRCEWWAVDAIVERTPGERLAAAWSVAWGDTGLVAGTAAETVV
jgi:phosphodiesterase/alkaline phosphatase D-like protein